MVDKDKRDVLVRPVILKFGVALAISIGGVIYTFFRSKRIKPSKPKPSNNSPGHGSQADSRGGSGDNNCVLQNFSPPKVSAQNSITDLFSISKRDMPLTTDDISPKKDEQSLAPDVESPNRYNYIEHEEHNKEINILRNKVKMLEERERMMEIQLLEYYGLKEQETAIIELQNRIKLNSMETKLYTLKIESLQSDKRRLEAQVADYAKVVTELEAAKAKIKLLRKKLRSDAEQNREQILSLQERVMKWRDEEVKAVEIDDDVEMKELEEELEEVKKLNNGLKWENSELARKLEYVQRLATSALDNEEVQELKQESQLLKQQNEDLRQEIERIQADRCTEIEELVYLRWINACLRYEMRNYQPGPGKTIARDLSKSLSPESEERAKQLILEYANKEGLGDKTVNISDFDFDQWSISQTSYLTDSGEPDDNVHSALDTLSNNNMEHSTKKRVFAKLMKLVRGKDSHHEHHIQTSDEKSPSMENAASVDDIVSKYSFGGLSRHSYDLQRSNSRGQKSSNTGESSDRPRRASDDISLSIFRRIGSISEYDNDSSPVIQSHQEAQNAAKIELVKYAEALKNSRGKSSVRRRAASFSSF
ncbi:hypothetical protein BUALT_Bualt07G0152300 [Buddleja alternifolia]|uniref:Protein CHUP1, chloroplastic n=1 Tax=Buddleja alternifolia TaxID=168488 RepID=A0AAV6XHN8_9LAMI|nr:hypothetical protein BUALT_Bualt07G0152300 [Buddleja alternifolia]